MLSAFRGAILRNRHKRGRERPLDAAAVGRQNGPVNSFCSPTDTVAPVGSQRIRRPPPFAAIEDFLISRNDEENIELDHRAGTSRWRIATFFAIWLGLIFGTSCTVIRPQEFFDLVQHVTGADEAAMQRFAVFWGASWLAIVKGWHFTEFFILLILCVGAVRWWTGTVTSRSIVAAMLFCIAFAITDEWHQSFVPDRFGTVQDVLIDSLGVCAAGVYLLLQQRRKTGFEISQNRRSASLSTQDEHFE